MCGLCGLLGGVDWTDDAPGTATGAGTPRRQARLRRTRLLDDVLSFHRLSADDWHGVSTVVRGPTGRTELADSLMALWAQAEAVAGRPFDPLDPALLEHLARRARDAAS
jgi:hypothetical protein